MQLVILELKKTSKKINENKNDSFSLIASVVNISYLVSKNIIW